MSSRKQRLANRSGNMQLVSAQYSGPLPPAAQLIQYNQAVPDAAERIIKMAEEQSAHRRKLEFRVISSDGHRAWCGLIFAFIIAMCALASSVYLIMNNHDTAGGVLFTGALASVVGTFIYGSNQRRKERETKK